MARTSSKLGVIKQATADINHGHPAEMPRQVWSDFRKLMKSCFNDRDLPAHDLTPKNLKEALLRPIESLPDRATRADVSYAGSLFLHRKCLPAPKPDIEAWLAKLGRNQSGNSAFLDSVRDVIPRMFPVGWDSEYLGYCGRVLPSASSAYERSRKKGGARGEVYRGVLSLNDLEEACMARSRMDPRRKVSIVDDGGKSRIVTVATAWQSVLGPLHHLLYDRLSVNKWLLRGEATANSFKEFVRKPGEVFVSGDYEAATDNFVRPHSEFILREIFKNSRCIPASVQKLAIDSLCGVLVFDGRSYPQVAGQLMGNLLSFPLLCLTNYLAFRYAFGRESSSIPVRINGDDIVFRTTPEKASRWCDVVRDAGLVLSRGKTLIHGRFFSLNSTFFEGRICRTPSHVPVIRSKAIYSDIGMGDGVALGARAFAASRGFCRRIKDRIIGHLLGWHRKAAKAAGCSLTRGLGIQVSMHVLADKDLLDREVHYLDTSARVDIPRKPVTSDSITATCGWSRVRRRVCSQAYNGQWGRHCREFAWQRGMEGPLDVEYGPPLYGFTPLRDRGKLALRLRRTRRWFNRRMGSLRRNNPSVVKWLYRRWRRRRAPDLIWVPDGEPAVSQGAPRFHSGGKLW